MLCWEGWGWRHLATHLNILVSSFMIPILILACRFVHSQGLSATLTALISGVIILTAGQLFFYAAILFLAHTSIYASRAPATSLTPGYQANVGQYDKNAVYGAGAAGAAGAAYGTKDLNKGYGADYVDPKEAAYNPNIQHERDIEMTQSNVTGNPPVVTSSAAPNAPALTQTEYAV